MHLALLISLVLAAVFSSIIFLSFACVRMFRRWRIPLCYSCCDLDDLELGRVADGPETETEQEKEKEKGTAVWRFGWAEIESLTGKFAAAAVIGEGGSSTVYLARLGDASLGALKLHRPSERLYRAFRQELDVLLRLRHPHIVRLLGYCDDREEEGVLVFEYVPNGSLHEKLHGGGGEVLPWARRMTIAYQVAQALDYLHEGCDPQVVHGDVKAANVLLDGRLQAKLCDFGSARVGFSAAVAPPRSADAMVVGSPGYVDPYYLRSGMVSKKNDVYSFGVLLLELVTGAEAFDSERERQRLTAEVGPVLRDPEGRAAEAVDARLGSKYDAGEAKAAAAVAAMCVGDNPGLRPSMAEVVRMLRDAASSSIAAVASKSDGKSDMS
ncbi:salt tolerance receptor-like cytoplasmic kinase 1 [Musa acuminata AAA Group]|uniref:salt tolerance receptor-like cytoplasmic kinase 1 n=1 Tax=Musa acuminata AAA Group TaxID=214697 RepID=UPI0031D5CE78